MALRKYPMTELEAPYEVSFPRLVNWPEAQEQMVWLVHPENNCEGFFVNGSRSVLGGPTHSFYRFTHADTAFFFKLRFR
jgi:hypothetical protein